jgi:hypothetical protein
MEIPGNVQQHVIQKLGRKAPNAKCPLCGVSNWGVQAGVYYFAEATQHTYMSASNSLPCAALVCQNCGNTHFINLLVLDPEWFAGKK